MHTYNGHSIVSNLIRSVRRNVLLHRDSQDVFLAVLRCIWVFPDVLARYDVLDNVEYRSHEPAQTLSRHCQSSRDFSCRIMPIKVLLSD